MDSSKKRVEEKYNTRHGRGGNVSPILTIFENHAESHNGVSSGQAVLTGLLKPSLNGRDKVLWDVHSNRLIHKLNLRQLVTCEGLGEGGWVPRIGHQIHTLTAVHTAIPWTTHLQLPNDPPILPRPPTLLLVQVVKAAKVQVCMGKQLHATPSRIISKQGLPRKLLTVLPW